LRKWLKLLQHCAEMGVERETFLDTSGVDFRSSIEVLLCVQFETRPLHYYYSVVCDIIFEMNSIYVDTPSSSVLTMQALVLKLQASAAQAAQTLATIGVDLDDMAATDEYVQSDGYNAPSKRNPGNNASAPTYRQQQEQSNRTKGLSPFDAPRKQSETVSMMHPQQSQPPRRQPHDHHSDEEDDDASTISTHSSAPSLFVQRQRQIALDGWQSSKIPATTDHTASSLHSSAVVVPLKVNVPEPSLQKKAVDQDLQNTRQLHRKYGDNDNSSASDEDDPILAYASGGNAAKPVKKASRFMDDLDTRMATPQAAAATPYGSAPPEHNQQNAKDSSATSTLLSTSWLPTFLPSNPLEVKAAPKKPKELAAPAPLARFKPQRHARNQDNEDPTVAAVVSSTTLLGESEWRALQQLQKESHSDTSSAASLTTTTSTWSSFPRHVYAWVSQHPREAFIGITLLVGILVYLFSNGTSGLV
jgi:hypothetical protein